MDDSSELLTKELNYWMFRTKQQTEDYNETMLIFLKKMMRCENTFDKFNCSEYHKIKDANGIAINLLQTTNTSRNLISYFQFISDRCDNLMKTIIILNTNTDKFIDNYYRTHRC